MVAGDCFPWLSRKFVVSAWRTHSSFTTPDPQTSGMKMKSSVRGSSGARFQFQNITLHRVWLSSEHGSALKIVWSFDTTRRSSQQQ